MNILITLTVLIGRPQRALRPAAGGDDGVEKKSMELAVIARRIRLVSRDLQLESALPIIV